MAWRSLAQSVLSQGIPRLGVARAASLGMTILGNKQLTVVHGVAGYAATKSHSFATTGMNGPVGASGFIGFLRSMAER